MFEFSGMVSDKLPVTELCSFSSICFKGYEHLWARRSQIFQTLLTRV